ncbi:FtsK/SpoIIIE domain-containing protein [Virgisporangium ochraceum]|nr:FtsK/SpoIIIE domain-containing protein [Virgisporangium ochraceum]
MFDPVYLGIDEYGHHVHCPFIYRNLLVAGEPGSGKSGLLNNVASHATLASLLGRVRLVLFDAKLVELGPYMGVADEFVGLDLDHAIDVLERLLIVARNRYYWLLVHRGRKIEPDDNMTIIVTLIDELAMYSTVLGTKQQQERFVELLRGLVSLGRACGMPVVAATQRPSFDIIPTSLRDLFGYRAAFRCTTIGSSAVILGQGQAEAGYNANDISPTNPGEGYLIAEGGTPRRIKAAYLSDAQIYRITDYATDVRRRNGIHTADMNKRLAALLPAA